MERSITFERLIERKIIKFTTVLHNLYRNRKRQQWRTNVKKIGEKPIIASISLGRTRTFQLKHNTIKGKHNIIFKTWKFNFDERGSQLL
jgi:alkylated DNA repair dioxygenase AlkB